jgi:hypothetical protein
MREPFDAMVPKDKQIDEQLGQRLAAWAKGAAPTKAHEAERNAEKSGEQSPALTTGAPMASPKADEESARGLFGPDEKPAAPAKPGATKIQGVDVDDESQALTKAIAAEKAKLERQPSDSQWGRLCKAIAGTEVLDLGDPAALRDLLELTKKLVAKDPAAIAKARAIILPPAGQSTA